jgi:hypothetical protein
VTTLSHVSDPISPRKQRHLVFIYEFNIQLLYLPGLKNVIADFLSRPPLESTETVAATAAADPVDFAEMATEQNRCTETQRLLGGSSLKLAFRQIGAQRLAGDISTGVFHPIIPLKFRKYIFHIFTMFFTQGGLTPLALFHPDLFGEGYPATSLPRCALALAVSRARSTAKPAYHRNPSPSLSNVFLNFKLTWRDLYNTVVVLITFLLSLTAHPNDGSNSLSETSAAAFGLVQGRGMYKFSLFF